MRTHSDRGNVPTAEPLNVDDPSSIVAWAAALGVHEKALVEAVRTVGSDLRDLRAHLARSTPTHARRGL